MYCLRVDGNDLLAVHQATAAARALALEKSRPVFLELMTYRRGHHSTSDDSTRYRSVEEIEYWNQHQNPISRFRAYIESKQWWDDALEKETRDTERAAVLAALETAEHRPKPPMEDLFSDVYAVKPDHLVKQEQELKEHVQKYAAHYSGNAH